MSFPVAKKLCQSLPCHSWKQQHHSCHGWNSLSVKKCKLNILDETPNLLKMGVSNNERQIDLEMTRLMSNPNAVGQFSPSEHSGCISEYSY